MDGFAEKIKKWWMSFNVTGTGSYIMASKLKMLRLLSEDELLQKVHLAMEFEEVAKEEEIAWRQRSRIQ